MPGESYHFDRLTQEMIVSQLKGDPHAPARAAEIARQTIAAGIKGAQAAHSSQEAQESVRQICHGAMAGLLLLEKSLPDGAVALLQNLADAAQELHLDPAQLMTWAMEGIARVSRTASPQVMAQVQQAINAKFMGAGEVFAGLCHQAKG